MRVHQVTGWKQGLSSHLPKCLPLNNHCLNQKDAWNKSKPIWMHSIWRVQKMLLLTERVTPSAEKVYTVMHMEMSDTKKLVHGTHGGDGGAGGESCWRYTYFIGISIFYWSAHYIEWWPGWRFNQAPFSSLIRLVMTRSSLDIEAEVDAVWPPVRRRTVTGRTGDTGVIINGRLKGRSGLSVSGGSCF